MASADSASSGPAHVRLVSADRQVFVIERRVALAAGLIRTMLSNSSFAESKGEIEFPEIQGAILEKVIQYLHYKVKHQGSRNPIPEFPIPPEIALELLMAANYLDC
jgi:transcription elongation factor B subunit 1